MQPIYTTALSLSHTYILSFNFQWYVSNLLFITTYINCVVLYPVWDWCNVCLDDMHCLLCYEPIGPIVTPFLSWTKLYDWPIDNLCLIISKLATFSSNTVPVLLKSSSLVYVLHPMGSILTTSILLVLWFLFIYGVGGTLLPLL